MTLDAQPARLVTSAPAVYGREHRDCASRSGPRWFVVWTDPCQELDAIQALASRPWTAGWIETFLPLIRERSFARHGANARWQSVPLWPRYLCARFDPDAHPWGAICRTPHVGGVIRHAPDAPTPLPLGTVEDLMNRTSSRGCVDDIGDRAPDMPIGSPVSLVGAFQGVPGHLSAQSAPNRLRVLLSLFARVVPVDCRPEQVEAA